MGSVPVLFPLSPMPADITLSSLVLGPWSCCGSEGSQTGAEKGVACSGPELCAHWKGVGQHPFSCLLESKGSSFYFITRFVGVSV